jgi:hypothetical protein
MQPLLDLTASRLVKSLVDHKPKIGSNQSLCLISKRGCAGASGQSYYEQNFQYENADDSSVFMSSMVPTQVTILSSTTSQTRRKHADTPM